MKRKVYGVLLATLSFGVGLSSAEFPLTVVEIDRDQVFSFPGGYGGYGNLRTEKPAQMKTVPKAVSQHPLYGEINAPDPGAATGPLFIWLDESKGTGKGYDRLAVDLNRNGDLTDDAVTKTESKPLEGYPPGYERAEFGPIELGEGAAVGQWQPRVFVQMYLYNKEQLGQPGNHYIGQLTLRSGNYLAATVEINGVKEKIGVVDGNCNFRMGDAPSMTTVRRSADDEGSFYLSGGDSLLRDRDGSGKFERTLFDDESEVFSSVIYFGAEPCTVSLADDLSSIRVSPYTGSKGVLEAPGKLTQLSLAWERAPDQWEALSPAIADGRVTVPVGSYRIISCAVGATNTDGNRIQASSSQVPKHDDLVVADGGTAQIKLGLPLTLGVTTSKRNSNSDPGFLGAVRSLFGTSSSQVTTMLTMNVNIAGAGGEKYSGFLCTKRSGYAPPPSFEVLGPDGKQVASGNFEYG